MRSEKSIIPDLKELGSLILGFLPWLLFLFFSGSSLSSLERAIVISLAVCPVLGFKELRQGFILQWGTLVFFSFCLVSVNLFNMIWVAKYMDLLSNTALAGVMWLTILLGKPFVLQYARRDLPKEKWNEPGFIRGCLHLTIFWASLMTISALMSVIKRTSLLSWPGWAWFALSNVIIVTGLTYTTVFKRQKRLQRARASADLTR